MSANPFVSKSTLAYELPPFELIKEEHYLEAFYQGMQEQLREIDQILANPEVSFENTIEAMERSGAILNRVLNVFYNKSSSDTNDVIDSIEAEIAPKLAAHSDAIRLNPKLFSRIKKDGIKEVVMHESLTISKLHIYDQYLRRGWNTKLVKVIKATVVKRIPQFIAAAWLAAYQEAHKQG